MPDDALKTIYDQVCATHNAIADFRAKLLALLPISSGTGIFLLLSDKVPPQAMSHLVAVGIFGVLVTIGLYLYELRGIHRCNALIQCGRALENELLKDRSTGAFLSPRDPVLNGFVSLTWASLMVYPTVIGAWSYVACMGRFTAGCTEAMLIAGGTVLLFMVGGKVVDGLQERTLNRDQVIKELSSPAVA
jgi:hypothetical protein